MGAAALAGGSIAAFAAGACTGAGALCAADTSDGLEPAPQPVSTTLLSKAAIRRDGWVFKLRIVSSVLSK